MTDWTTLTGPMTTNGSVANWLNRSSVQGVSATIIEEAESVIYRRLRHWKMLTSTTGSMVIGNDYITLPSDYLEDKRLIITGVNYAKLARKTMEEVLDAYSYDNTGVRVNQQPVIYFNDQTNLKFDSPADQTYPYLLYYYQQPAALSGSNTTNFLTTLYPRLLRCACMAGAAEFMKDAGVGNYDRTYWVQMTEAELATAQSESDRSQRSIEGGAILA